MTESTIRSSRQIQTYLWNPKADVKRHLLVDTVKREGYNPDNNYDEGMESLAFETWDMLTNGDEILQEKGDAKGIYQFHNEVVQKFLSDGYEKIKTRVRIHHGDDYWRDFGLRYAKIIWGVNDFGELNMYQIVRLQSLIDEIMKEGKIPSELVYSLNK